MPRFCGLNLNMYTNFTIFILYYFPQADFLLFLNTNIIVYQHGLIAKVKWKKGVLGKFQWPYYVQYLTKIKVFQGNEVKLSKTKTCEGRRMWVTSPKHTKCYKQFERIDMESMLPLTEAWRMWD